jgi:osmotically-inducible protein OsmY
MAWETKGTRSVKNNIAIKQKFSFKNVAMDVLITSQLRAALILNKNVKAANFNIDTINQKTYVFGIAYTDEEKKEIIQEAKQIVDLKELVTSILLVSDLSRQKESINFFFFYCNQLYLKNTLRQKLNLIYR